MMSTILRFFASDVAAKGIAVLFIPLFSYFLGPAELGQFSEWFSLFNVLVAIMSMGVPSYVLVLLSQNPTEENSINQKSAQFLLEWFIIVGMFNLLFVMFAPNVYYGFGLYIAAGLFVIVNYAEVILRHKKLFKKYFLLQMSLSLSLSLVPFVFVFVKPDWESRVLGCLVGLLVLVLGVIGAAKKINFGIINKVFRVNVYSFGSSIVLMTVVSWLKLGADIQFLKADSGYESSGVLFFGFQIVSIVSIVAASLNRSSSPSFYELIGAGKVQSFQGLVLRLSLLLCGLAVAVICISWLLVSFFLLEFKNSIFLIVPMAVGAVIYGVGQFIGALFLYHEKPHLLTISLTVSSLLHPLISYCLVSYVSWQWIGWSYPISSIIFVGMVVFCLKKIKSSYKYD